MRKVITASLLALAGTALVAPHAKAVSTPNYQVGDLLLGFRLDNGGSYVLDIGPASLYTNMNGGTVVVTNLTVNGVQLAPIAGDLSSTFGAAYPSGSGGNFVHWSVSGTDLAADPTNTLYISRPEVTIGTPVIGYNRDTKGTQSGTNTEMENFASGYNGNFKVGGYTLTASGGEVQGSGDQANYSSFNPPGESSSFGAFSNAEGIFSSGTAGTALDLFRLAPSTVAGQPGTYEGRFTINDSGVVTFSSVPEPASFALLASGAACCGFVRRRKSLSA